MSNSPELILCFAYDIDNSIITSHFALISKYFVWSNKVKTDENKFKRNLDIEVCKSSNMLFLICKCEHSCLVSY